jgi:hypothetical protein
MDESVIDVAERFLGVELNVKTISKLSMLNQREAIALHDRIKSFYVYSYYFLDKDEPPNFSFDGDRYAILTDRDGNIDSYEAWYDDEAEYIKKLLLYYPSLAVLDPIDELLSLCAEQPSAFEKAFAPLLPVRPLIKTGVIRLVPGSTGRSTVLDQIELSSQISTAFAVDEIFDAFKVYDPESYEDIVSLNLDLPGLMLSKEELDVVKSLSRKQIPSGLLVWSASIFKEMYVRSLMTDITDSNMALISDRDRRFFTKLMSVNQRSLPQLAKTDDNAASCMISLNLPNISKIPWADILTIRENDEDFFFWRDALKQVMRESYISNGIEQTEFLKDAKKMLAAKSRTLRESVKQKSSLKDKIVDAWIPAGIGFAAGILGGSITTSLAQASLTGSLSLLYSLFMKRASKSEKALCRHFSVFIDE